MAEIYFRGGNPSDLKAALASIPSILAGTREDTFDIVRGFRLRLANALLSQIQQDFITKSRGGTGKDGIKWAPLSRKTIAQRRTTPGELKSLGVGGKRVRGLLTPSQDKEWLEIYRRTFRRLRWHMDPHQASNIAFATAWIEIKKQGAKTKLEVLGGRIVDILRDTGLLFRSFSPGVDDAKNFEAEKDGQIIRESIQGSVTVGSNQKPWHHKGIEGRLPSRPFWPIDGGIPPAWMPAIRMAAMRGLNQAVKVVTANIMAGKS